MKKTFTNHTKWLLYAVVLLGFSPRLYAQEDTTPPVFIGVEYDSFGGYYDLNTPDHTLNDIIVGTTGEGTFMVTDNSGQVTLELLPLEPWSEGDLEWWNELGYDPYAYLTASPAKVVSGADTVSMSISFAPLENFPMFTPRFTLKATDAAGNTSYGHIYSGTTLGLEDDTLTFEAVAGNEFDYTIPVPKPFYEAIDFDVTDIGMVLGNSFSSDEEVSWLTLEAHYEDGYVQEAEVGKYNNGKVYYAINKVNDDHGIIKFLSLKGTPEAAQLGMHTLNIELMNYPDYMSYSVTLNVVAQGKPIITYQNYSEDSEVHSGRFIAGNKYRTVITVESSVPNDTVTISASASSRTWATNSDYFRETNSLPNLSEMAQPNLPFTGVTPYTIEIDYDLGQYSQGVLDYVITATNTTGNKDNINYYNEIIFESEIIIPEGKITVATAQEMVFKPEYRYVDLSFGEVYARDIERLSQSLPPFGEELNYPFETYERIAAINGLDYGLPGSEHIGTHLYSISLYTLYPFELRDTIAIEVVENCENKNWYLDNDGDGYGAGSAVAIACNIDDPRYVTNNSDTNDQNPNINPAPAELSVSIEAYQNGSTTPFGSILEAGNEYTIKITVDSSVPNDTVTITADGSTNVSSGSTTYQNWQDIASPSLPYTGVTPYTIEVSYDFEKYVSGGMEYNVTLENISGAELNTISYYEVHYGPEIYSPDSMSVGLGQLMMINPGYSFGSTAAFTADIIRPEQELPTFTEPYPYNFTMYSLNEEDGVEFPNEAHLGTHTYYLWVLHAYNFEARDTLYITVDANCTNTEWYADNDGDGYGAGQVRAIACDVNYTRWVSNNLDCDDRDANNKPGIWYADADGDGFGDLNVTMEACSQPPGYVSNSEDCDDTNPASNPDAAEIAGDGLDNDCDGTVDENTEASCYATEVIEFVQGHRKDRGYLGPKRSDASKTLGAPQETNLWNFVSLGFGGHLTLKLGSDLYDGGSTDPDMMIVETTWGWSWRSCYNGSLSGTPETIMLELSPDGNTWVTVPGTFCRNVKIDISPVVGNEAGQIPFARYVRITDTSNEADFFGSANGYDVDGIITCPDLFEDLPTNSRAASMAGRFDPNFFNIAPDNDDELEQQVTIYPQPASTIATVKLAGVTSINYTVTVLSLEGRIVSQQQVKLDENTNELNLNVEKLPQGVYLLQLEGEGGKASTHRLMKQ
jgi:hypothetical protein